MKDDNLKLKLEEAQIPSNSTFLQTKKTNPEISSVIPWLQCTHDCRMQSIEKSSVASTTRMLKVASKLTKLLPKQDNDNVDIKTPLSLIKKSLSLARKFNQTSNQFRPDIIKPTLSS